MSASNIPYTWCQKIGLLLGLILFALILLIPLLPNLSGEAQRAAAVAVLMAAWWISEALPIAATALIPLALYPLLGVMTHWLTKVTLIRKHRK